MKSAFSLLMLALLLPAVTITAAELSAKEQKRKALVEASDTARIRGRDTLIVESGPELLRPPDEVILESFDIATTPPTVSLQILPDLVPEFFSGADQYMACWANWAEVTRGPDGRFFFAASDHLGKGCHINLYEYRPGDDGVRKILDLDQVLGWNDEMYTDGKVHGHMGIMADGTLWGATHFGVKPTDDWYAAGYRGSWLFSYNTHTGEAANWGVPLVGNSLPCFTVDTRRGRLVGTGEAHTILTWDIDRKQVRFAGYPPNGWIWWQRSMLCDVETGIFWGMDESEKPFRLMSFDPELNRFTRTEITVPLNPHTGEQSQLRGHTSRPDAEGWYYWTTRNGAFFRFQASAEGPRIESLGVDWDRGRDTKQLAIDPTGRYVYYQPGAGKEKRRSPIVQYDTRTGRRKVICWFQDLLFEKYGYWCGSHVYGMEISADGSFLLIVQNGAFTNKPVVDSFGHPSVTIVTIPESERPTTP